MKTIIPIAGPDYFTKNGIKGLCKINNSYALEFILKSRPWHQSMNGHDYIFVMQNLHQMHEFKDNYLDIWFPGSCSVFISEVLDGATLSVLAGIPLAFSNESIDELLIVDLADIHITSNIDLKKNLSEDDSVDAMALTFQADLEKYSYFQVDSDNYIIKATEKSICSIHASTGIYIFKGISTFMNLITETLKNPNDFSYNSLLYMSLLFNACSDTKVKAKIYTCESAFDYPHSFMS